MTELQFSISIKREKLSQQFRRKERQSHMIEQRKELLLNAHKYNLDRFINQFPGSLKQLTSWISIVSKDQLAYDTLVLALPQFYRRSKLVSKQDFSYWTQLLVFILVHHPKQEQQFIESGLLEICLNQGSDMLCYQGILHLLSNLNPFFYSEAMRVKIGELIIFLLFQAPIRSISFLERLLSFPSSPAKLSIFDLIITNSLFGGVLKSSLQESCSLNLRRMTVNLLNSIVSVKQKTKLKAWIQVLIDQDVLTPIHRLIQVGTAFEKEKLWEFLKRVCVIAPLHTNKLSSILILSQVLASNGKENAGIIKRIHQFSLEYFANAPDLSILDEIDGLDIMAKVLYVSSDWNDLEQNKILMILLKIHKHGQQKFQGQQRNEYDIKLSREPMFFDFVSFVLKTSSVEANKELARSLLEIPSFDIY